MGEVQRGMGLIFLGGLGNRRNMKLLGKDLSREYHVGNRVYDSDGIAQALTSQPLGGFGGHTGLYLVREER